MADAPVSSTPSDGTSALVGREWELAVVDAFLAAPWPRLLLVEGPAGIGKTTIVDAAIRRATERGALPLVARATLAERELPFATLASLLPDPRIDPVLPALAPPRRRALEIALRRATDDGAGLDGAALGLAVLDVVRAIARPIPALIVLDDLQWCDEPTPTALAFAMRRAVNEPLAILGGVRVGVPSAALDSLAGALAPDRVDRLPIGPLSLGAILRILEARTGRGRPRALAARISEAAGGSPLLALELARAIDVSGRDPAPGEPLAVPASAEPLIAERLGRLTPAADDAVLAVALAGRATIEEVRAAATGDAAADGAGNAARAGDAPGDAARAGEAAGALDQAVRAGLLELDGAIVRLGHPLVGAAAAGRATPERRRAIHRRLAAVVADPEAALRHRALAADGPDAALAADLVASAARAAARGAPAIAAELAELAVERTPADDPASAAERWRHVAEHRLAATSRPPSARWRSSRRAAARTARSPRSW